MISTMEVRDALDKNRIFWKKYNTFLTLLEILVIMFFLSHIKEVGSVVV